MVKYTCERCTQVFSKKYNYEYHINRKYPCTEVVKKDKKLFKCLHCDATYTRKFNLDKHILNGHKEHYKNEIEEIVKEDNKKEIYQLKNEIIKQRDLMNLIIVCIDKI